MAAQSSPDPDDPVSRVARLRGELRTQQRRYGIAGSPPQVGRLEMAMDRHRSRIAHLRSRIEEMTGEITRLEEELVGYARGLEALLGEELERVRSRFGEAWSPSPVLGFRLWALVDGRLEGARTVWPEPRMTAVCATTGTNPDEVPHSDGRCGRLGCGIYAAKEILPLLRELTRPATRNFVAGLVALHGKVVEHERGYRGARAEVLAVAAVGGARIVLSDDPEVVERMFRRPASVVNGDVGAPAADGSRIRAEIATYLNDQIRRRNDPWTSVSSSG